MNVYHGFINGSLNCNGNLHLKLPSVVPLVQWVKPLAALANFCKINWTKQVLWLLASPGGADAALALKKPSAENTSRLK